MPMQLTRDEINELILEKVDEAADEERVKNLLKDLLNFERTQYTGRGRGGGYIKKYREFGREYLKEEDNET